LSQQRKAYFALCITSIVWGTSWIASKIGVQLVPGLEIASLRQIIAGALIIGFFLIKGEKLPTLKQLRWLTITAALLFVSANGIATVALKYIPSGMGALISALYPLSVVIIERIFYKGHKITTGTIIGLLLGIGGIAVVFYDNAFHNHTPGYAWGVLLSIAAMLSWSVGTIVISRNHIDMNPYYATGWQMLLSSFILIIMLTVSGTFVPIQSIPAKAWGVVFYLIIMSNLITYAAFVYTMHHLPPAVAALYAYVNPIVAILAGTVVMDEKITLKIILGSVVTLVGVYLVNQSLRKQREKIIPAADADGM
jgi:drug/metabolite transporter (DMT)-like permease